jgi:hypothetical protein
MESGIGWVPAFVHRVHEHHEKRAELLPAMTSDPRTCFEQDQVFFSFALRARLTGVGEHRGHRRRRRMQP